MRAAQCHHWASSVAVMGGSMGWQENPGSSSTLPAAAAATDRNESTQGADLAEGRG